MINFRLVIAAILCMVLFSLFSQGCDKDKSPTEPKSDMILVGIWKITKMSSEYQGKTETYTKTQLDSMGFVWTFKIKDNGTIEQTTNIDGPLLTFPGTWSTSAKKLSMTLTAPTGETGTIVYEYAIDGNILKLYWTMQNGTKLYAEFTKQ